MTSMVILVMLTVMNVTTIAHSIVVTLQQTNAHLLQFLFLQSVFYMFRAIKSDLQEVSFKITAIQLMSTYMVYGKSSMCGYTGITINCSNDYNCSNII